jgi:branched-chain amino acid transport system substrate-binding protein
MLAPAARLACATAGLLALAAPAGAAEVVVGMSAAFTGPSRGLGIEMYRGAMACFAEANSAAGPRGRKIVLKAYDDRYEPGPALANTRKLIAEDKAFLLFGYVGTPTITRALPLLKLHEKDKVFLFCPFTGAELLRQGPYAPFVFNLRAGYRDETAELVDAFVKLKRKRIAVFYQIDAYGRSGWDGVRRALARRGLKMCAEATYRRGARFSDDMGAQVKILMAGQPDAVICVGAYAACAAFVRDARDAGLKGPIANLSFVGSESLLALLAALEKDTGRDYTSGLVNTQVVPSYAEEKLPAVKLYRETMKRHAPKPPADLVTEPYQTLEHSFTSLEGFLAARLVVQVLDKLGPEPKRDRLRAAVEAEAGFDLGLGRRVRFGGKKPGLGRVYFTVVEKGRFVPLADWKRWQP